MEKILKKLIKSLITQGIVVHCDSMVLSAHDLGRHVSGRAGGVFGIVRVPDPRHPEVRDPQLACQYITDRCDYLCRRRPGSPA